MGNNIVEHTLNKVVFLDRDGTLNEEVNYLHKPEDMKLLPGVPQALKKLKDAGYTIIWLRNGKEVARIPYLVDGEASSYYELTGLTSNTEYTLKFVAKSYHNETVFTTETTFKTTE